MSFKIFPIISFLMGFLIAIPDLLTKLIFGAGAAILYIFIFLLNDKILLVKIKDTRRFLYINFICAVLIGLGAHLMVIFWRMNFSQP